MGKYDTLGGYLRRQPSSIKQVALTFAQIEKMIADELPYSARAYFRWWDNEQGDALARVILSAGWRITMVDMEKGKVRFQRI